MITAHELHDDFDWLRVDADAEELHYIPVLEPSHYPSLTQELHLVMFSSILVTCLHCDTFDFPLLPSAQDPFAHLK